MFYAESEVVGNLKTKIASNLSNLSGKFECQDIAFQGLGMFRNSVVWAAPVKGNDFLHMLYDLMEYVLLDNRCTSILPSFIPHVTLFKSDDVSMNISPKDLGILQKGFSCSIKLNYFFQKFLKIISLERVGLVNCICLPWNQQTSLGGLMVFGVLRKHFKFLMKLSKKKKASKNEVTKFNPSPNPISNILDSC